MSNAPPLLPFDAPLPMLIPFGSQDFFSDKGPNSDNHRFQNEKLDSNLQVPLAHNTPNEIMKMGLNTANSNMLHRLAQRQENLVA